MFAAHPKSYEISTECSTHEKFINVVFTETDIISYVILQKLAIINYSESNNFGLVVCFKM